MSAGFAIGSRAIGHDHPPYVIAEAGVNHNGDPHLARDLVDAAAEAGADAVKFQTFDAALLATADASQAEYQRAHAAAESQRAMLRELELPLRSWADLAAHARRRGVTFLSTPFDPPSVELLARLDVPAFKIGSGDLTNAILLRATAHHRRPMMLSTGMATMREVEDALEVVRNAGAPPVAVLHCASAYPAPTVDLNLRAIDTLRERLGVVVGFSDHSEGIVAPGAAIARGAAIVEKHLTLDRSMSGPDQAASLEPSEFAAMVRAIRESWDALGDGRKEPRASELDAMRVARRSLVASRPLRAGQVLTELDLAAKRPGSGISPMRIDEIVGRRVLSDRPADYILQPTGDFEPPLV